MSSSSSGSGQADRTNLVQQQQQQQQAQLKSGQSSSVARLNGLASSGAAAQLPANASSSSSITREWVETQDRRLASDMGRQQAGQPQILHRCRTDIGLTVASDQRMSSVTTSLTSAASLDLATTCQSDNGLLSSESAAAAAAAVTAAPAASSSGGAGPDYDSSGDRSGGGRSEPSRTGQSRLRSRFNPLYKQRNALLHRLFKDLPAEERLVTDSSCAWDRSGLLVQGRLYATASRLCFYSKIIGFETKFVVPLASVVSISKEKTARIIPNAISVQTGTDKYFFASIGSRDRLHSMLDLLWQKAIRPEPLDPALFWELVRESYGSQVDLDDDDADLPGTSSSGRRRSSGGAASADSNGDDAPAAAAAAAVPCQAATSSAETGGEDASANGIESSAAAIDPLAAEFGLRSRRSRAIDADNGDEEPPDESADPCELHEHFADEYLNVELPASVDTVFQCLFAHKSAWFRQFARQRGMTDVCAEPWRSAPPPTPSTVGEEADAVAGGESDWRARRVTFTLPLNNAVGPRSAQQIEEQAYRLAHCRPGRAYRVDVTVRSREVPYCDSFHTRARYCLTSRGPACCRLRVTTDLRFTRSLFKIVRNLIDSSAKKGLADHFNAMRACLVNYLASRGAPGADGLAPGVAEASVNRPAAAAGQAAGVAEDSLEAEELLPDLQSVSPSVPPDASAGAGAYRHRASAGSGRLVVGCLLALCCLLLVCFFNLHARCNQLQMLLDRAAMLQPTPSQQQQQPVSHSSPPSDSQREPLASSSEIENLVSAVDSALQSLDVIRQSLVELRQRIGQKRF